MAVYLSKKVIEEFKENYKKKLELASIKYETVSWKEQIDEIIPDWFEKEKFNNLQKSFIYTFQLWEPGSIVGMKPKDLYLFEITPQIEGYKYINAMLQILVVDIAIMYAKHKETLKSNQIVYLKSLKNTIIKKASASGFQQLKMVNKIISDTKRDENEEIGNFFSKNLQKECIKYLNLNNQEKEKQIK